MGKASKVWGLGCIRMIVPLVNLFPVTLFTKVFKDGGGSCQSMVSAVQRMVL